MPKQDYPQVTQTEACPHSQSALQEKALTGTKAKLEAELHTKDLPDMQYRHCCHSVIQVTLLLQVMWHLILCVPPCISLCVTQDIVADHSASLVCFNLGYLPSAEDKPETATNQHTTVAAIAAALQVINNRGLISVMAYLGHPGKSQVLWRHVHRLSMIHRVLK